MIRPAKLSWKTILMRFLYASSKKDSYSNDDAIEASHIYRPPHISRHSALFIFKHFESFVEAPNELRYIQLWAEEKREAAPQSSSSNQIYSWITIASFHGHQDFLCCLVAHHEYSTVSSGRLRNQIDLLMWHNATRVPPFAMAPPLGGISYAILLFANLIWSRLTFRKCSAC